MSLSFQLIQFTLILTGEGLKYSPTKNILEDMIDQMNAARPLCPVGLNTLVIPRRSYSNSNSEKNREPYVYVKNKKDF